METRNELPNSLLEAVRYFSDPDVCRDFVAELRWPNGVSCPREGCGSEKVHFIESRKIWRCNACKRQFSVKVGTIFEDSPIGLEKWLPAIWMLTCAKQGVSSYQMARALGVTQKTAWFLDHRIRLAIKTESFLKPISGEVEVDETFIGGKARFMHKDKRADKIKGTGTIGKTAVLGLLERHGPEGHSTVRASVVSSRRRHTLVPEVRKNVAFGSEVFTDALPSYASLKADYNHQVIDHAEKYVDGKIHTNGVENYWSLLKRAIKGTYVSVEPFHLFRYLDEEAFRFNSREMSDSERFRLAVGAIEGKRVTYKELINE